MKIVLLDEAQKRFEAEDRWWREHRDATEVFITEFEEALRPPVMIFFGSVPGSRLGRSSAPPAVLPLRDQFAV